jgi:hypothetical protein
VISKRRSLIFWFRQFQVSVKKKTTISLAFLGNQKENVALHCRLKYPSKFKIWRARLEIVVCV